MVRLFPPPPQTSFLQGKAWEVKWSNFAGSVDFVKTWCKWAGIEQNKIKLKWNGIINTMWFIAVTLFGTDLSYYTKYIG